MTDEVRRAHALLTFCARPVLSGDLHEELQQRIDAVAHWDEALRAAEQHGMGPLLYRHTRTAQVRLPSGVSLQLCGLYLRHRHGNAVRLGALADILAAFGARAIRAWILKGPALMGLVYGDPALRPISDLDLLVPVADAIRAQAVLAELGWHAPVPGSSAELWRHHHLPVATRTVEGVGVQVEIHHSALSSDFPASMDLDDQREAPLSFELEGRAMQTLGLHEGLSLLCEHLVGPLPRPFRLIWAADVIGYAETFADRLDWARLQRDYPVVIHTLRFLGPLVRLPDLVRERAGLGAADTGDNAFAHLNEWSWSSVADAPKETRAQQLWRTLNPPDWWMRLRYGPRGQLSGRWAQLRQLIVTGRAVRRRARKLAEFGEL